MTHVPLWRFYAYFLRLGATGFGGPVALAGFMQARPVPAGISVCRCAGAVLSKAPQPPVVKGFVDGVSAAATGAIAGAAYVIETRAIVDVPTALIAIASLAVLSRWKISELWVIACAAGAGMAFSGM